MKVTDNDVRYVEDLANLELTAAERERMVRDLNSILDYIDQLNEADTANLEPMAQTSDRYGVDPNKTGTARFEYTMRPDQLRPSIPHEAAVQNAPDTDGTFFKVPKVIEK
jgi:aspartyl-tRNA(Asn)/glutamyl-tRNA(Gln) amidotransferase subunit C